MKKLAFILFVLQLQACAFTKATLDVKHAPDANFKGPLQEISSTSFLAPAVSDAREVTERIGYKKNGYGMNTADIVTKTSVEEIVGNALTDGLTQNGHTVSESGKYSIVSAIKTFWFEIDVNFFTVEFTGEILASLELLNTETNEVVYTSDYSGTHSEKKAGGLNKTWERIMSKAVDKLVEDIVYDEELAEAIEQ